MSSVTIFLKDKLSQPIQNLKTEIRGIESQANKIYHTAMSGAQGEVKFSIQNNTPLSVYVKRSTNSTMKEIGRITPGFRQIEFHLTSPKISRRLQTKSDHQGSGNYWRGTYTVKKGDTLTTIAKKYDTTVDLLATVNRLEDPNFIRTGQKLKVLPVESRKSDKPVPRKSAVHKKGAQQSHPPAQVNTSNSHGAPATHQPASALEGSSLGELIRQLGDAIATSEGGPNGEGYDSYNTGTNGPHGRVGHSYFHAPPGTVTGKTINEILATEHLSYTNRDRFYTTGKYQTVIPTLRKGKKLLGLTGEEKYDANMQERVFKEYLILKAGGAEGTPKHCGALGKFIYQGVGSIDDAQYAAAKEWASIATPAGKKIAPKDGGMVSNGKISYYESHANHASMVATRKVRSILELIQGSRK